MTSSSLWFVTVFVILLLVAFVFGVSSIFKQLDAGTPARLFSPPAETAPWQTEFPLLP